MFTFLSWHGNYENMELPQLSIHRVEYYHWQDQIGRQTKTELIFISLHYFVTSQYFSKWFFSSSKNKPLVRLIQSHTWFAVRQKKKKKLYWICQNGMFMLLFLINVVWLKQFVSLVNIFWILIALTWVGSATQICLNSEFNLHKPNSPCSFSFLEQTVPVLTLLEALLWTNSFCLIMSSSLMISFLTCH